METIIICGGTGFIGSNMVKFLSKRDNIMYILDNNSSGNFNNMKNFVDNKKIFFIEHDITNKLPRKIRKFKKIDKIYNFACPASPVGYLNIPIETTKASVLGVLNLLELAREKKSIFFQSSTSEVYGDPLMHPQNESYWGNVNPIGVRSCYDEGKRCAESLIFDYKRKFNLDVRVARIFNTYGPYMNIDGRVVSNFIWQALNDRDITIYGDGTQTRSFCYIDDLIVGIDLLMNYEGKIEGPINLGNPMEFMIIELAKKVTSLVDTKSSIVNKGLPSDDPKKRKPDISKAKSILGWEPTIKLDEGLKKTIEYFKGIEIE